MLLVACNAEAPSVVTLPDGSCGANGPAPEAPRMITPVAGSFDTSAEQFQLAATSFTTPNGQSRLVREFEIWLVSPEGTLTARSWSGLASDDAMVASQGSFEVGTALTPWTDYAARARDIASGACPSVGSWSEPVLFRTDDGSAALFAGELLPTIRLTISEASIAALNAQAYPPGCVAFGRDYQPADAEIEGEAFVGVGVHIKGGCGSSRSLNEKPSLKISLQWDDPTAPGCPASRRWRGQKTLTLNNMVQDATQIHEVVGYEFIRSLGVPSPRATHALVEINGSPYGVYTLVETIDRRFLERTFGSDRGMLYEGAYWCDLISSNLPADESDTTCMRREFKPDACDADPEVSDETSDETSYAPLRELIATLDAASSEQQLATIETHFDWDGYLRDWAAMTALAHWDAYHFHIINNYRIYHDVSNQKWSMIQTGIDQTFAGFVDPQGSSARLPAACLRNTICRARYFSALLATADAMESFHLSTRTQAVFDRISDAVFADPKKSIGNLEISQNIAAMRTWIEAQPNILRAYVANH